MAATRALAHTISRTRKRGHGITSPSCSPVGDGALLLVGSRRISPLPLAGEVAPQARVRASQ